MKLLAAKIDIVAILRFASASFTAKIDFDIFRLTSITKNNFCKIHLSRWKDAVFTVERLVHWCIFLVSTITSLFRTVSAQFRLTCRIYRVTCRFFDFLAPYKNRYKNHQST